MHMGSSCRVLFIPGGGGVWMSIHFGHELLRVAVSVCLD